MSGRRRCSDEVTESEVSKEGRFRGFSTAADDEYTQYPYTYKAYAVSLR